MPWYIRGIRKLTKALRASRLHWHHTKGLGKLGLEMVTRRALLKGTWLGLSTESNGRSAKGRGTGMGDRGHN